jgi:exodeoxyribonuclease VIII
MNPFPNGIHLDIPADVYHAANGVSNSMLANMDPPARLPVYLSNREEPTPWMRMGTIIHHAMLEPDKPLPRIITKPAKYPKDHPKVIAGEAEVGDPMKWTASKWCQEWEKAADMLHLEVVTESQLESIKQCVRALEQDEMVANSLATGEGEVSVFADIKLPSGRTVTRRCRMDWVRRGQCAYDIKKVGEGKADRWEFAKLARDRRYFVCAAYYMDTWNAVCMPLERIRAFCWLVVEDTAPYLVTKYHMEENSETHFKGREIYTRDLEAYAQCIETGVWPGYAPGFQELKWPREWSKE